MTEKTHRIIVDVTQLIHWRGKLTGIPRVMNELAARFEREGNPNVVFATWVKDVGEMYEVDFVATMLRRGQGIVYRKQGDTKPVLSSAEAKAVADALGPRRKITLRRVAKYGIRQTARVSKRLADKLEQRAKMIAINTYQRVEFQKADLLFIPWGEWWDPNFIQRLKDWHKAGVRLAPIIHDVAMIVPQFLGQSTDSLADYTRNIVPISAVTLAVSQNTKKDLTRWLQDQHLPVPRIDVFRLGEDFEFSAPKPPEDPVFTNSGLKGDDYIMCMGTVELKKNHMLLYYVYKLAKQRGIELPKLLMVGRRGWKTETLLELIADDPDTRGVMIGLHDINDEELAWLYDRCMFTVLPSFYEGWGIPIAESLARGVPAASSNTSSMVEIAPGFVEHFSPYSTEECLAAIQKLLDPKHLKAARENVKRYKQTSWDDSYKQVIMSLQKL